MKPLHRTPNIIKSLTLKLSLAEGVEIADLQNKRYRLTVPLNGLVFDNHAAAPAWFYAVFPPQLGSGAVPVPSGIRLVSHQLVMSGADSDDVRQAIVSRLVLDLEFAEDAQTFTALPLVIKGHSVATNGPAAFSLPAFTPSVDAPFVVADADGGALATGIAVEALGMPQGDADTLQSEDGDYYLSRTNHTGTQEIDTVSGLQDALDDKAAASHTHSISEVSSLSAALDDLMEATLPPGGSTGQVLAKTSGTHYDVDWVDATSGGGGGAEELGDLTDVALTTATSGQVLKFNGSEWTNADESGGGGSDSDTLQGEDGNHYLNRANHTGSQAISTVSGLQTALDGKAAASHTHDDRYYTESEVDAALTGKAAASHSHSIGNVTGLQDNLDELAEASIPVGGSSGQVLAKTSGSDRDVAWVTPSGGGGGGASVAYYQDQKSESAHGGTATAGSWQVRDLTTEVFDPDGIGTLSGNEVTLGAGKYVIRAGAPAFKVNKHMVRLYNVTDAALIAYGTTGYADTSPNVQDVSFVSGYLDISSSKAIRLEHYFGSTRSSDGLGIRSLNGIISIYAWMEITKIG